MRVAVLMNPVAGGAPSTEALRARVALAQRQLHAAGASGDVIVTAYPGHARELAADAAARGADVVAAWGGDGTVNEVAGALAHSGTALGIIPSGSGNGLARLLGIPAAPADAIDRMVHGRTRAMDAGTIDGRLFVNVAGVGFDAHIAALFAARAGARRGFLRYAGLVLRELRRYRGIEYRVALDGGADAPWTAFLVTFANGRQWGNGALIAPRAAIDDGALDVVIVEDRGARAMTAAIPRLFRGTVDRAPGVTIVRARSARVSAAGPLVFHVDGEPVRGGAVLEVRVLPGALTVRC
jgi:YegS/Rv2252/BmrU family lipid kinase